MPNKLKSVVVCIGSNVNCQNVRSAIAWLKHTLYFTDCSSIYSTPPVNEPGMPYDNAVVIGHTELSIDQLNNLFKDYELDEGRTPESRKLGIVPIDIDIVIYDNRVIREWDFRQNFFQIGFSELTCSVIKK